MGAMENWGLVTYRTTAVLFEEGKSDTRYKNRIAYVVAHGESSSSKQYHLILNLQCSQNWPINGLAILLQWIGGTNYGLTKGLQLGSVGLLLTTFILVSFGHHVISIP